MTDADIPILKKAYDLYRTFNDYRKLVPKSDRFTIYERSENAILDMVECILEAGYSKSTDKAAVLERAYAKVRSIEASLSLDDLNPEEALRRLVEQTFESDDTNENFVRLVAIENIHRGVHLQKAVEMRKINVGALKIIDGILRRGRAAGQFRSDRRSAFPSREPISRP